MSATRVESAVVDLGRSTFHRWNIYMDHAFAGRCGCGPELDDDCSTLIMDADVENKTQMERGSGHRLNYR